MTLQRRTLLSLLMMSALLPATANCSPSRRRVVVIGAGIAGLGAAAALRSAGIDVVVIEARDRIGGRIHTSSLWPGLPMDLGASWIHGTKHNPVTALAREIGAELVTTSYDSVRLAIDPALAAQGVSGPGNSAAEALLDRAMDWADRQHADVSMQTALDAIGGKLNPARRAQRDFYVSATYEQEYGASADRLSAWTIDDNEEFAGEDALFPRGYGQIIEHLARGADIRTNRAVTRIDTGVRGVTLTFADGETMIADQVLVTVPLGVLKSGKITFNPPLSPPKARAVERLGMGLLNKHWLRFDRVFWPEQYDWHEFLSPTKDQWTEWVSLAKIGKTPVLLAFTAADFAERIEHLSDRDAVGSAMETARKMFGTSIPDPVASQITRWRADPWSYGSYSYNAVGSSNQDRSALAATEADRVFFAGEATSALYPGTVHGALISGREAALRIVREDHTQ